MRPCVLMVLRGVAVILFGVVLTLASGGREPVAAAEGPGPLAKLVDDAALRLQTADPVAAFKYRTGGAVDDPVREQQVIDSVTAAAEAHDVEPSFVRDIFRDQMDATASLEHSWFAQWKIDPGSAPTEAPDLSSSREVINELNAAMVEDIAEQWNALQASTCPTDLENAIAAAITKEHLDGLHQKALHYAVHRYCR